MAMQSESGISAVTGIFSALRRTLQVTVFFVFVVAAALSCNHGTAVAADKITVLKVGLLIDGNGGAPVKDAVVVIEGKRIKVVGRSGEVEMPAGAEVIDLGGKTLIPGLVDTHAHYREWQGEIYIAHGVTTAFDIGDNPLDWSFAQKDGIAKGRIVGPRLLLGGRLKGRGEGDTGAGGSRGRTEVSVGSVEEAREEVRKLIALGVDAIKALDELPVETLKMIAEEAHKAGKPVIAHSVNGIEAVLAGVQIDSLEHSHTAIMGTIGNAEKRKQIHEARTRRSNRMTSQEAHSYMDDAHYDSTIRALLAQKTHWSPTMATSWRAFSPLRAKFMDEEFRLFANPSLAYIPTYFRENTKAYFAGTEKLDPKLDASVRSGYAKLKDFVRRFAKAGGKLQTGSDPNSVLPALAIHHEMALFVEAGLSPMEAIMAATRNPAELMHREKDFGTIAPGRFADMVVLDANPLDGIDATRKINVVFQEGRLVKPAYHADYRNPIARPQPDRHRPHISDMSPETVTEGEGPVTLTIKGRNFIGTAMVKLDGKPLATKVTFRRSKFPQNYRRSRELTAEIPAELLKPGTHTIVVEHSGVGGSVSNTAYLIVRFK